MAIKDSKIHYAAKIGRQVYRPRIPDGVLTPVAITVNGTPEQFDVSAFLYALGGSIYYHAASTAHALSAVHATGIAKWLGALVMVDRAGTISTLGDPDTGDQDHATEAAALASLVGLTPAGKVAIGTITLLTGSLDWDGNTDAFDEADLVASNLLGYQGDRRLGQYLPGGEYQIAGVKAFARAASGVANLEVVTARPGYTGILTHPRLEVDTRTVAGAAVKMRHGDFDYAINGVVYHKSAAYDLAFTAAHVVALNQWGAILFQINAAGTISTKVGEATATTPLDYATEALARAAAPAPDASNAAIALLIVEADAGTWTANTDDLLAAGDLEAFDILPELHDRLITGPALALDEAEEEDFQVGDFTYIIDGVKYTKTAADGIDFTAAHVCTALKFLAILVEIDAAGTVATKVPLVDGRSQTAAQGYDTAPEAIAALPPQTPGKVALGYILVNADAGNWTANTDDMEPTATPGDLTSVLFHSYTAPVNDVFAVQAGTIVTNVWTDETLATRRQALRGANQFLVLLSGTTGIITDPEIAIEYRPYPMAAEA
jgi:hypothetical protein